MSYRFRRISYGEICQKLIDTKNWLRSLGIGTNNTRFPKILEFNIEIKNHYETNRLPELLSTHDNLELWYATVNIKSFINISSIT